MEKKPDEPKKTFEDLVQVMEALRGPNGCPWDKEQTHESIKSCCVEETYELMDAIDDGDPEKIKEELGDLLFQVIFHSKMASEKNQFDVSDVIDHVTRKLTRRHPHVFEKDKQLGTAEEVLTQWEKIKRGEKGNIDRKSVVDGIPKGLPALQKAHKIQKKVSKVGFDWPHVDQVLAKVDEELAEVRDALKKGEVEAVSEEIGDLLFSVANLSRFLGLEAENVLHKTVQKFSGRFRKVEKEIEGQGRKLEDCSLEEMDQIWERAKK